MRGLEKLKGKTIEGLKSALNKPLFFATLFSSLALASCNDCHCTMTFETDDIKITMQAKDEYCKKYSKQNSTSIPSSENLSFVKKNLFKKNTNLVNINIKNKVNVHFDWQCD